MPVGDFIVGCSVAEIQRVTAGDPDYMMTPALPLPIVAAGNW